MFEANGSLAVRNATKDRTGVRGRQRLIIPQTFFRRTRDLGKHRELLLVFIHFLLFCTPLLRLIFCLVSVVFPRICALGLFITPFRMPFHSKWCCSKSPGSNKSNSNRLYSRIGGGFSRFLFHIDHVKAPKHWCPLFCYINILFTLALFSGRPMDPVPVPSTLIERFQLPLLLTFPISSCPSRCSDQLVVLLSWAKSMLALGGLLWTYTCPRVRKSLFGWNCLGQKLSFAPHPSPSLFFLQPTVLSRISAHAPVQP